MPVAHISNEYDILIDRRTRWGNPFSIGVDGDRAAVIEKHRQWLWKEINSGKMSIEDLAALDGKILGCHCAPAACHGDNLVAAAKWAAEKLKRK